MIATLPRDSVSPSLDRSRREIPAFEVKFFMPQAQALAVEAWIGHHMQLDPHCDPALGNSYDVSSVYCDTPDLAVFHKAAGFANRKFRLRRYGNAPGIFLERKTKWGDRLVKRRTLATPADLSRLGNGATDRDWPAFWFHRHLQARRLWPTCHVSYRRTAYFGVSEQGPIRLTLDRHVVCVPHSDWAALPSRDGRTLIDKEAILELKFSTTMPVLFRRLVYELSLAPNTFSKYRRAIQVWGLDALAREQARCLIG
jgi:hypothetical protein